jgi:hypothetical protein
LTDSKNISEEPVDLGAHDKVKSAARSGNYPTGVEKEHTGITFGGVKNAAKVRLHQNKRVADDDLVLKAPMKKQKIGDPVGETKSVPSGKSDSSTTAALKVTIMKKIKEDSTGEIKSVSSGSSVPSSAAAYKRNVEKQQVRVEYNTQKLKKNLLLRFHSQKLNLTTAKLLRLGSSEESTEESNAAAVLFKVLHCGRIFKFAIRSLLAGHFSGKAKLFELGLRRRYLEIREATEETMDKEILLFNKVVTQCYGPSGNQNRYACLVKGLNYAGHCQGYSSLQHSFFISLRKSFSSALQAAINASLDMVTEFPDLVKCPDNEFQLRRAFFKKHDLEMAVSSPRRFLGFEIWITIIRNALNNGVNGLSNYSNYGVTYLDVKKEDVVGDDHYEALCCAYLLSLIQ